MSIQYKMIIKEDKINPEGLKKTEYHPLVVRANTIALKEICKNASQGKSISAIEIETSVLMLLEQIKTELRNSNQVCLDGFGTFSITAESRPVEHPDGIQAESIFVNQVVFMPSKKLMSGLKKAEFVKVKE